MFTPTSAQQQVFSLSWLSNTAAINKLSQIDLQSQINKISSNIGNWLVVWGPNYFFENNDTSKPVANAIFVAQALDASNNPLPTYVIAIAGTNKSSAYDWFSEDLDPTPVSWPYVSNPPSPMHVTTGDNLGISNLLSMTSVPVGGTQSVNIHGFLAGLTNQSDISLWITGHSLGGALAPMLMLALLDPASTLNQSGSTALGNWKSASLLATAGPSIGDQNFVNYFNATLGNSAPASSFVWNGNDVVPHAWNSASMNKLTNPNIYGLNLDPTSCLSKTLANMQSKAAQQSYVMFQPTPAFAGTLQPYTNPNHELVAWNPQSEFLAQTAYQHINAYITAFNTTWFTAVNPTQSPTQAWELLQLVNLSLRAHGLC